MKALINGEERNIDTYLSFGKFKGKTFETTPKWYQKWLIDQPFFKSYISKRNSPRQTASYIDFNEQYSRPLCISVILEALRGNTSKASKSYDNVDKHSIYGDNEYEREANRPSASQTDSDLCARVFARG